MKAALLVILLCWMASTAFAQTQYINDPSMELSGAGGTQWIDTDYNYVSAIVNSASNANTGNHSAYFEAIIGQSNMSILSQVIVNLAQTYNNKLEFYIKCFESSGASTDIFAAIVGGKNVYALTGLKTDSAKIGATYKKIIIPIDTLPAGLFEVQFFSQSIVASSARNLYMVDDITLTTGLPTAISTNCTSNCDISITPNITNNFININQVHGNDNLAKVFNFAGQLVHTIQLYSDNNVINIESLAPANYLVVIVNKYGQHLYSTKIIKQ